VNCQGLFGRLFGHRYVATHTKKPPTDAAEVAFFEAMKHPLASLYLEGMETTTRIYVGHVCARCGNVVNKQEAGC
jgi:hypothetical protein